MRVLITGMNGTVAPALAAHLEGQGHEVVGWDRTQVPTDDARAVEAFLREQRPDWFAHVATGSADWAALIAEQCAAQGIRLLFTSSVSVFGPEQRAPLTPDTAPGATDDYGRYKREVEQRMRAAYPELLIARLAWQIGDAPGSNTMVDYIEKAVRAEGQLQASTNWYPACAFLADTAAGLHQLMKSYPAGIYHLDGNPGLSFHAIAEGLKRAQGRDWTIVATEEPVFDNRMRDDRLALAPITARLGER